MAAALLRFAARKVCSRASLERAPPASFTATKSVAVVKEERQRTLPWTIFHGRVSSPRWFSSSSESPDKILAAQMEDKKQELRRLLREMDELSTQKCAIAAMERKNKVSEKKIQLLFRLLSLGHPWYQLLHQLDCDGLILRTLFIMLVSLFFTYLVMCLVAADKRASKKRGPTPQPLPST